VKILSPLWSCETTTVKRVFRFETATEDPANTLSSNNTTAKHGKRDDVTSSTNTNACSWRLLRSLLAACVVTIVVVNVALSAQTATSLITNAIPSSATSPATGVVAALLFPPAVNVFVAALLSAATNAAAFAVKTSVGDMLTSSVYTTRGTVVAATTGVFAESLADRLKSYVDGCDDAGLTYNGTDITGM
jgi:hypothetical protein